jgi:predicted acyltransferase
MCELNSQSSHPHILKSANPHIIKTPDLNQRYYSLDVFRGATVALMILVNNPGSWSYMFAPLKHAKWHGCTPTDLVFPFFLFAVGNAMSFVMPRWEQANPSAVVGKILKRTLLIFAIGIFLNWAPFIRWDGNELVPRTFETLRFFGVLQRIALAYCFAALIVYFFNVRGSFVASVFILLFYWFLCLALGNPADPYSLEGFFGTHLDRQLFGEKHLYRGEGVPFDPEGLGSTPAAIVQVIFGYFVGRYIQQKGKNFEMLSHLFIAGCVLVFTGFCWDLVFPINKKIWTSSYVCYTTGLAMMVLGIMVYLVEFREQRGAWSRFFVVFGKNPLFIFVLSGFLPRVQGLLRWVDRVDASGKPVYITPFSWFYEHICKPLSSKPEVGSLVYALCMIAFYWLIVYLLDKKKIYIRV